MTNQPHEQSQHLVDCAVNELRFDGRTHFVVCGWDAGVRDTAGRDVLARNASGRILVGDPDSLRRLGDAQGWEWLEPDETWESDELVVDVEPVQEWLRGRAALDLEAALGLWNMAVDVARTLDLPFRQRGRTADVCYDKLFAAGVPRFAWSGPEEYDGSEYRPVWTPRQYRTLRRVMGDALHVLRVGVPTRTSR